MWSCISVKSSGTQIPQKHAVEKLQELRGMVKSDANSQELVHEVFENSLLSDQMAVVLYVNSVLLSVNMRLTIHECIGFLYRHTIAYYG